MSLAEERAAAAGRRDAAASALRARRLLDAAGWTATRGALFMKAEEIWDSWTEEARGVVVEEALELAAAGRTDQTRIDPMEADVAHGAKTEAILEALRELLRERPTISPRDAYEMLQGRGVDLCAFSSFQGHHMVTVRKELGVDRRMLAAAAAPQLHIHGEGPMTPRMIRHINPRRARP